MTQKNIFTAGHLNIFFGQAHEFPMAIRNHEEVFPHCNQVAKELGLEKLARTNQVHGIDGRVVDGARKIRAQDENFLVESDETKGDYLITTAPNVGLAIFTADCLPVVFYDPIKRVIANAHAGWRGSVTGICSVVIKRMREDFDCSPRDIQVWLGAAGKECCYEVTSEFPVRDAAFIKRREGKIYFDNIAFNLAKLHAAGITNNRIHLDYNDCTICDHRYHSYRRSADKTNYAAQATIVWLT